MTQKYGTSFVRRGEGAEVSNLPEYFLHSLPKNQEALPEYYLLFARKLLFEKFGGGGGGLQPLYPRARLLRLSIPHNFPLHENYLKCYVLLLIIDP